MVPPAKRRKRNVVDSDDEDDDVRQQPLATKPRTNSLQNFLLSPSGTKATADVSPSPSPVRKSTRSSTVAANAATASRGQSNGAAASQLPPSFVTSRGGRARSSKASTKSPSASPEKKGRRGKFVEEKGKSADLVTLFSKQAQRVKAVGSSQPATTARAAVDDILSDPISEEDDVAETKAAVSSVVGSRAHMRFKDGGGNAWSSQPPPSSSAMASSQFIKPPRPPPSTLRSNSVAADDEQRPWSERFAPANLDELAVHRKKVADVRRWLEDVLHGRLRQRLLVLKGAAGSGKTTTVQLLARDLGCEILEWRNPTGSLGAIHGYQSASAQFEEFLGRGGKFGQLDMGADDEDDNRTPPLQASTANGYGSCATSAGNGTGKPQQDGRPGHRLMLIEEFPNTFMRSSSALTSFRNNVLHFLAMNTPSLATFGQQPTPQPVIPLVMIISETLLTTTSASADSFTAHRLLGPEILRHPGTGLIEFNAIAPSILAKALELVVQKEARRSGRRRTPGPLVLKRLGEIGDIRNAISSLEFLCLKGDGEADWGAKVAFTKSKKGGARDVAMTRGERESLELVSQREASLGIFHAVGKVVYNKRDELPHPPGTVGYEAEDLPAYMAHLARPKPSLVAVDTLIDETGTDASTFISALHENYALSCEASGPRDTNSSIDYINGCIDRLSESDLLCPSWDVFFGGKGGGARNFGRDLGSHVLRQDEMAFEVAVRGLLFSLPCPVKRQAPAGTRKGGDQYKMFFPTSLKLWRAKEELEGLVDMWTTRLLNGEDCSGGSVANGTSSSASRSQQQQQQQPRPQSLTNGAAAFRKPGRTSAASSSVGDHATNRTELKHSASSMSSSGAGQTKPGGPASGGGESTAPLLSLGASARKEMLLERLPYMAHMARRRRGSFMSVGLRDLEKLVSVQGIGGQSAALADDEDDPDVADAAEELNQGVGGGGGAGDGWATDKPTDEASPRKKRSMMGGIRRRAARAEADAEAADALLAAGGLHVHKLVLSDDDIEDD